METTTVVCCCGSLAVVGMLVGAGMGYLTKYFVFKVWPEHFTTKGSQTILLWFACVVWAVLCIAAQFVALLVMGAKA